MKRGCDKCRKKSLPFSYYYYCYFIVLHILLATSRYPSFALGVTLKPPVVRFRNRRVIVVTDGQQASSNQMNPVGIIFFHRSFVCFIFWM